METLYAYLIGMLAASYLLIAWFHSTMSVHLMHILRRLGWRRQSKMWEIVPEWDTEFDDMVIALVTYNAPKWMQDLYVCKYCISFHIALWTAIAVYSMSWVLTTPLPHWFIIASAFSWPTLMLFIEQFLTFLNKK